MIRIIQIISFIIILGLSAVSSKSVDTLPFLTSSNQNVIELGGKHYIRLDMVIPLNGYIYANPKGPGIGKPLSLNVDGINMETSTILVSSPVKETSFGSDFVWVYKKDMQIMIPVIKQDQTGINIIADGLFCSKEGRCTPFKSSLSINLNTTHDGSYKSEIAIGGLIPFGKEPSSQSGNPDYTDTHQIDDIVFTPVYLSGSTTNILYAILYGLIAGLILNFMPCVFPVLSIKLFGFIHSGRSGNARKTGLAYTAGIISSFLLLASLSATIRSGWGSLFQSNTFIIITVFILFAMALSFLGVFSLNIPGFAGKYASRSIKNDLLDSFIKGLLAAILATPCSGPFLGATLAWTMTKTPIVIFIVFTAIGIGMSIPYLILVIRPSLLSVLPKPGRWMIHLEKILGILLIGSVIYFIQILPGNKILPVIIMLCIGAIALWQFGRFGNFSQSVRSRTISFLILILLCVSSFIFVIRDNNYSESSQSVRHQAFRIENLRESGRSGITAVIFTADWCPNCKLVEYTVLNRYEIVSLFKKKNVTVMTADITREGTEGELLLRKLGSVSIPFLAIFPEGKGFTSPVCLRDIYSAEDVTNAIEKAEDLSR